MKAQAIKTIFGVESGESRNWPADTFEKLYAFSKAILDVNNDRHR